MKYKNCSIDQFTRALEESTPYPGGGSAVAIVGALAASLGSMVGGITAAKVESKALSKAIKGLKENRKELIRFVDEDIDMYKKVVAAYALPKSHKDRAARIEDSLHHAFLSQYAMAKILLQVIQSLSHVKARAKGAIVSDLKLSFSFVAASFEGACHTAQINLDYMKGVSLRKRLSNKLSALQKKFKARMANVS